jgi:hypothetical protein
VVAECGVQEQTLTDGEATVRTVRTWLEVRDVCTAIKEVKGVATKFAMNCFADDLMTLLID